MIMNEIESASKLKCEQSRSFEGVTLETTRRIRSIDFVKGLAILFIVLAHISVIWFSPEWVFLFGTVYLFLDILGPSLFIFLSALSVIFSIRRKQYRLPENVIRNRILTRAILFLLVGIFLGNSLNGFNPSINREYPFPLSLWGWDILVFIGFSQLVSYYIVKLSKFNRLIIALIIILASEPLRAFLFFGRNLNPFFWILNYIITSPAPHVMLLPWIGTIFLSSIFGEYLYDAMIDGSKGAYRDLLRNFTCYGFILLLFGMISGFMLINPLDTEFIPLFPQVNHYYYYLNQQDFIEITALPLFLIRSTFSFMWYSLGAALLIIAISFYFLDIKKKDNIFIDMLIYYGNISLSLYIIHFAWAFLYRGQFPIYFFPFVMVGYLAFLAFLLYFWNKYAGGIGTPEWLVIQMGKLGQKKIIDK